MEPFLFITSNIPTKHPFWVSLFSSGSFLQLRKHIFWREEVENYARKYSNIPDIPGHFGNYLSKNVKLFALIQIDEWNNQLEGAQFCIHAWTLNNQPLLNIFEQSALSYIYLRKQWGNILIHLMIYADWRNDLYRIMNSDMIFWVIVISRSGPIARPNQAVNRFTEHNIKEIFRSRKTSKYCRPHEYMSQLLLLGKFKYGWGPIFKVVLEC